MLERQQSEMDKLNSERKNIIYKEDDLNDCPYSVLKHLGEGLCSDVYLVE